MTFFFLDGSALAKRYVAEAGTPLVDHLMNQVPPTRLVVLNVGFGEVVSVLVRRKTTGRLTSATFAQALLHLSQEIVHATQLRKVEATNPLVTAALVHIETHSINANDAVALHATLGLDHFSRTQGNVFV